MDPVKRRPPPLPVCPKPDPLQSALSTAFCSRAHPSIHWRSDDSAQCGVTPTNGSWASAQQKYSEVDSTRAGTITVVPRRRHLPRCKRAGTRALALAESVSSSAAAVFWSPRPVAPAAVPGPSPASLPPPASSSAVAALPWDKKY